MRAIEQTVVLITGATDGLGRGVARRLARDGAFVHLHGRDAGRLAATADEIRRDTGTDRVRTHLADLAALEQVDALAADVQRTTDRLHVLINNAGIGSGKPDATTRQRSRDGYELRFAVNYLATFALTVRLLGLLRRSAPARVVNVASIAQSPIDFDDVMLERDYDGARAYAQSKLAQVMFGVALAERVADTGVTVNSLHPATFMPTKMVLEQFGHTIDSLDEGIEAVVRLAASPDVDGVSGRFYDRQVEAAPDAQAADADARRRLWRLSLELTGLPDVS